MYLSVIIPLYNEEDNIEPLMTALRSGLMGLEHEIIFVDDGSSDATRERVMALDDQNVMLISFSRNFGQTSAMAAGIDSASGEYIVTLDGDLQNDPADIKMMLKIMADGGYDVVAGRRKNRQDGFILRKVPSKIANYLIRKLTGVHIRDYGCTLKLFKTELAKRLDLYGELHRFIPILADIKGAKIIEVDVAHYPRLHGASKYGIGRTTRVISDLLLMCFFQKYSQKPMHLFGQLSVLMFLAGFAIEGYLLFLKMLGESIGTRPLFYVGILLIITSMQLITTGFLAELMMRTYYGSQNKKPYIISSIYKKTK